MWLVRLTVSPPRLLEPTLLPPPPSAQPLDPWSICLSEETKKNESVMATMIGNIINNLQITVKNIHVRYEDRLSTPDVSAQRRF